MSGPPPIDAGLPVQKPNPVITRPGAFSVGKAPSPAPGNVEEWAGREGVKLRYLAEYQSLYPKHSVDRKSAIKNVLEAIYAFHVKPSSPPRPPFMVTYQNAQGVWLTYEVKDPIGEFQRVLLESESDSKAKESMLHEIKTAIDEVTGNASDKPAASDVSNKPKGVQQPAQQTPKSKSPSQSDPFRPTSW